PRAAHHPDAAAPAAAADRRHPPPRTRPARPARPLLNRSPMTSIIRDRDDMPIQVDREVDVHGTVAADSPDDVLRLGNPANHDADTFLSQTMFGASAYAILNDIVPPIDISDPVGGLVSDIPVAILIELNHTLDTVVRHVSS